jgi:hypothetical protein
MALKSEVLLVALAATFALMLAGWLIHRRKATRGRRTDPWAVSEPIIEGDQMSLLASEALRPLPPFVPQAIQRRPVQDVHLPDALDGLPSAETRTMLLSRLADPCPACGGDCGETCEGTMSYERFEAALPQAPPFSDETARKLSNGVIRLSEPPDVRTPEHADKVTAIVEEVSSGWAFIAGRWVPPASAWENLPRRDWLPGREDEPDWLRQMLVSS